MKNKVLLIVAVILLITTAGIYAAGDKEAASDDGKMRIGFVVKSLSEYWSFVRAGALDAGRDFDVEVTFLGPNAETDILEQTAMMENLITQNVDALCVAPAQPKAAVSILKKAYEAGIPVLLVDTDAPFENKKTFLGTGNFEAGKIGGAYIASELGSGAKVVILRGALGDLTHDQRTDGAVEGLKEGGLEIIDIQAADSDRNKGMNVMENLLQVNKEIDAVFASNDEMALGAMRAIEQAGRSGIMIIGFDGGPDAVKNIKSGGIAGSVAQSPYNMGYMGVEQAIKVVKGEVIESRIDTGAFMINKENVVETELKLNEMLGK